MPNLALSTPWINSPSVCVCHLYRVSSSARLLDSTRVWLFIVFLGVFPLSFFWLLYGPSHASVFCSSSQNGAVRVGRIDQNPAEVYPKSVPLLSVAVCFFFLVVPGAVAAIPHAGRCCFWAVASVDDVRRIGQQLLLVWRFVVVARINEG